METSSSKVLNPGSRDRFQFLCRVYAKIDFRALNPGVTEPQRYPTDIVCYLQGMHRAGMLTISLNIVE